ncbi:hypothetical protein LINPERHAP2_LOCUS4703, partial [Linum perenne]
NRRLLPFLSQLFIINSIISSLSINHHPPSIVDQLEDLGEAFHPWIGT